MSLKTVSILLPCLNEEKTLEKCIKSISKNMKKTKYDWEIIVCDNNSTDSSRKIAKKNNVKVIIEKKKGYGATLLNGIKKSKSDYLVMLDSDMSYCDKDIPRMLKWLDEGYDFVIGNRFKGENTTNDAFPFLHKNGTKILNLVANILFNTKVKDFHCGLRAFKRDKILECNLECPGMEFASEMVIKAKLNGLKIKQFNTDYKKDERGKKGHLRTFRDGFRHLGLILSLRYNTWKVFKYIFVFIVTLLILVSILFLSIIMKNDRIDKNIIESLKILENRDEDDYLDKSMKGKYEYRLDVQTDIKSLSLVYLVDSNKPINSLIEMNYYQDSDYGVTNFAQVFENRSGMLADYSRYWHGQVAYLRPLLMFFTIDNIYIISSCILLVLLVILLKNLFKLDKLLSIILLISIIMVNSFIVPFCTEYFFVYLLMLIFSNLVVSYYKKNKDISVLMLVSGITTCFFDFLTCETLTLTVPLFIYTYLNKDKVKVKDLFKYILLWGLGYSITFGIKWLIDCIYYGFDKFKEILSLASYRTVYKSKNYFLVISSLFINCLKYIFPFNLFSLALTLSVLFIFIGIYNYLFNFKDKKKYLCLLLISLIPLARFLVLSSHSAYHMYFVYRSIIPFIMFILFVIIKSIRNKSN